MGIKGEREDVSVGGPREGGRIQEEGMNGWENQGREGVSGSVGGGGGGGGGGRRGELGRLLFCHQTCWNYRSYELTFRWLLLSTLTINCQLPAVCQIAIISLAPK